MLEPSTLLRYLSHATRFGGGGDVPFDDGSPTWELDVERLANGQLEADLTREVLDSYVSLCPDVPFGEKPVPIVVCLRWFVPSEGNARLPLLLMPGTLDVGGALRIVEGAHAWIPWQRLHVDGTMGATPTVCSIDALRAHQEAMSALPNDGSWSMMVQRAMTLFDAVCEIPTEEPAQDSVSVRADVGAMGHVEGLCPTLRVWEYPDSFAVTAELLDDVIESTGGEYAQKSSGPLCSLLGVERNRDNEEQTNALPDDELLEPKLLCGIPDHLEPLSAGDRAALLAFARQHDGDLLALHAPAGTNAVTVALAAMANRLTESALRGENAPVMTFIGTDSMLTAVTRALAERPAAGQTSLLSRWIPRIAPVDGARTDDSEKRILGPIPTLCMAHTVMGAGDDVTEKGMFVSYLGHPLLGDAMRYAQAWYVPQATTYFLDCVSGFFGKRERDVESAGKALAERLRRIDQDRCELIDAYAQVCRASGILKGRDELLADIGELRARHHEVRQALMRWEQVAHDNPLPKHTLMTRSEQDQSGLIAAHALPEEKMAQGRTQVADICKGYREELEGIERDLERLRASSAELGRRTRAATAEGTRCVRTIARLQRSCGLTTAQTQRLEAAIDGREVSMRQLDEILDKTVRPAEFWLAVHFYESRWLLLVQHGEALQRAMEEGGVIAWRAQAHLCPFCLVSYDLASPALRDAHDSYPGSPVPPVDLLVAFDSDVCDVATGAAALHNACRALVLGSQTSLGPLQPQGHTSDELYAAQVLGEERSEAYRRRLTASGSSSLFAALIEADNVEVQSLYEGSRAYGELDDLRSDLCGDEPLRSVRIPSNSADDPSYALLGIVPAISHVLVPDSSWQQVGSSRVNRAECLALVRWLSKHGRQLCERYANASTSKPVAIVSAYREQARFIQGQLNSAKGVPVDSIEVVALRDVAHRQWPVVLASATCGPAAYAGDCACNASGIISSFAACALDALLLFWGGAWIKSDDKAALTYLRRSTMVGRLYSVVRSGGLRKNPNPLAKPKHMDEKSERKFEVDLRAKPLSLTALLRRFVARGELPSLPPTSQVNLALEAVGLIERVSDQGEHRGWRPTAAGREVGILGATDRMGTPFCTYAPPSEPVVASTALTLLDS